MHNASIITAYYLVTLRAPPVAWFDTTKVVAYSKFSTQLEQVSQSYYTATPNINSCIRWGGLKS